MARELKILQEALQHINESDIDDGKMHDMVDNFNNAMEKKYTVELFIHYSKHSRYLTLDKIVVPTSQQGEGIGSKVMNEIIAFADKNGKSMALTPDKVYGGSSIKRLEQFYKLFGFVKNSGRNKDYRVRETMVRRPINSDDSLNESAKPLRVDKHGKNIVFDNGDYIIAVNHPTKATYITLFFQDEKVGVLSLKDNRVKKEGKYYQGIDYVEIDKQHRGSGMGTELYRQALRFMGKEYDGLVSYLPDQANKRQAPKIHDRLKARIVDGDYSVIDRSVVKESLNESKTTLPPSKLIKDWWKTYNPFDDEGLWADEIVELYLVGSRAKGTHHSNSDYDIAVIFPKYLYDDVTAIKLSEKLHQGFGYAMPQFRGNDVDLQVFFDSDRELKTYSKIKLK
jgi:predicted GNAT family N-acyltransferase/predicted nucleotidyltransferase